MRGFQASRLRGGKGTREQSTALSMLGWIDRGEIDAAFQLKIPYPLYPHVPQEPVSL
jgi:hypothetical protein